MKRMNWEHMVSLLLVVGILVNFCLVSSVAAAGNNKPVEIGSIFPLTGAFAYEGVDCDRAVKLAVEEVNAAGGIGGRPLKVIHEDSQSTHRGGMDAVHKLVDVEKVPAIVGAYSSGISLPTHTYANENEVIMMATSSTNKLRDVGPYSFDSLGLDEHLGPDLGRFVNSLGYGKVSFLIVNNACGISVMTRAKKYLEENGVDVENVVKFEVGQGDYRANLRKVFRHNPEAIVVVAYTKSGKLILKQAKELGLKEKAQWIFGYFLMATGEVTPGTAEGIIGLAPFSPVAPNPRTTHFRKAYEQKYGESPRSSWSSYIYDATWIISLAMNFAGTTEDTGEIRKAMPTAAAVYYGASGGGSKRVDAQGQQVDEVYYPLTYTEGKIRSMREIFPGMKYERDGTVVGLTKEDLK